MKITIEGDPKEIAAYELALRDGVKENLIVVNWERAKHGLPPLSGQEFNEIFSKG